MPLVELAQQVTQRLLERDGKVVFAESCTAGQVSATLSRIAGVSGALCGSAVTYRNDTKVRWLGVAAEAIHQHTAVSDPVARQMALNVLGKTPEAGISASVTGHLGPDAPEELDGVVFIAIAERQGASGRIVRCERVQLDSATRDRRQREAVQRVLQYLLEVLDGFPPQN